MLLLLLAQQLPPMLLPVRAQAKPLERAEIDHVLVVSLAHLQMDSQALLPLDRGTLPLAALPAVEATFQVARRPDGACPEQGRSLLMVADERVPTLTLRTLEAQAAQSCFSELWLLVAPDAPAQGLRISAVPQLGDPLWVQAVELPTVQAPSFGSGPPSLGSPP